MDKTTKQETTIEPGGKKKIGKLEDGYCPPKAPPAAPTQEQTETGGKR